MATLALSVAGQVVGGAVGGPIGATIGRALGALAGSAIDQALFSEPQSAPQLADLRLQGSSEGVPIPRVYGWSRLAGNIIWATQLELSDETSAGSKGFGTAGSDEDQGPVYLASFAVGLCEGEVSHIGRIWADGRLLEKDRHSIRTYLGTASQSADALIVAKQGADRTPACRGLCYLVFEALPLTEFGNRIPNITVEVCRAVGELESQIRAVTVIPGASEFGYDPEVRVRLVSPGVTAPENGHLYSSASDWTCSIDELQALCPNLAHVALVVAWFGDDLRCGECRIQPRVEAAERNIIDANWVVSDVTRAEVPVVSAHNGGAAYGGTPSDATVLAAIADLKARGLNVTLYPLILMDVPEGNGLTDPYSGADNQPAHPWRGRMTCAPAPGVTGSPDLSAAVDTQLNAFVGGAANEHFSPGTDTVNFSGGADWGYRRMILHYAHLCEMAGGVDAFLIGSELRGLTTLRNAVDSFPFVEALVDLAADVKAVVDPETSVTYAADWSEYSGLQPGDAPGDKLFHLDPLWASGNIDAVGIDNYMPIADWRGYGLGPDAEVATSPYDLDYLGTNIAAGEGHDWYYASAEDRLDGVRTSISDAAHGEPWIWRFKDLKSWWQNAHRNRIGGERQATPTDWVPASKPIWLTELGCAGVDKGANQPNVFGDAKSSEDGRPYFSDGSPDALIQRQFLRAHHRHWQPGAVGFDDSDNPVSASYGGRMVDPERLYCWSWDARPYPAFPQLEEVWADGPNHQVGHWLTGRLGSAASDELLGAMAADFGVTLNEIAVGAPLVSGVHLANVSTLRAAATPLWDATGLAVSDTPDGLKMGADGEGETLTLDLESCAMSDGPAVRRTRPNADEVPGQLVLAYIDRSHDYQSASAVAVASSNAHQVAESTNLILHPDTARTAAETLLRGKLLGETVRLALPPSLQAMQPGDRIRINELNDGPFEIETIRSGLHQDITGTVRSDPLVATFSDPARTSPSQLPAPPASPIILAAHIPGQAGDTAPSSLILGAYADPWPGSIRLTDIGSGAQIAQLESVATLGVLANDLHPASPHVWDRANQMSIQFYRGHPGSVSAGQALSGTNRLLVQKNDGTWEVIGFASAELIAPSTYLLTELLRGQLGTDHALSPVASAGNPAMIVDSATRQLTVPIGELGETRTMIGYAGAFDLTGQQIEVDLDPAPALPLAPARLKAIRAPGTDDVGIQWLRRSRIGGDSWTLPELPLDYPPETFRIRIFEGETLRREVLQSGTTFTYDATMQTADFGAPADAFDFTVEQMSAVLGAGHAASGQFGG